MVYPEEQAWPRLRKALPTRMQENGSFIRGGAAYGYRDLVCPMWPSTVRIAS